MPANFLYPILKSFFFQDNGGRQSKGRGFGVGDTGLLQRFTDRRGRQEQADTLLLPRRTAGTTLGKYMLLPERTKKTIERYPYILSIV